MGEFPTIFDFLQWFSFLRGEPTAYLLFVTAFVILVVADLRWTLFALLAQYLLAGLLLADVLLPHIVLLQVLVGIFVCLILYITARQVNWGKLPEDVTPEELSGLVKSGRVSRAGYDLKLGLLFRFILGLLVIGAVWAISGNLRSALPLAPNYYILAILGLGGLGLVTISLTSEPLKGGMGMFTFLVGFELVFATFDDSPTVIAIFASTILFLSLVISYLAQTRHAYSAMLD